MYLSHDKFDASEMTLGNPSKKELCFNWGILTFDKTLRTVTEETSPRGKVAISEKKENIGLILLCSSSSVPLFNSHLAWVPLFRTIFESLSDLDGYMKEWIRSYTNPSLLLPNGL